MCEPHPNPNCDAIPSPTSNRHGTKHGKIIPSSKRHPNRVHPGSQLIALPPHHQHQIVPAQHQIRRNISLIEVPPKSCAPPNPNCAVTPSPTSNRTSTAPNTTKYIPHRSDTQIVCSTASGATDATKSLHCIRSDCCGSKSPHRVRSDWCDSKSILLKLCGVTPRLFINVITQM